jgi:hypothetical protein
MNDAELQAYLNDLAQKIGMTPEVAAQMEADAWDRGVGWVRTTVSPEGKVTTVNVDHADVYLAGKEPEPGEPCPECGSTKWHPEMGGSYDLRHYRNCSQWHSYFDGGDKP